MAQLRRKIFGFLVCILMLTPLSACGQSNKSAGPDYADDEAMSVIAKGFEKRSDIVNAHENTDGADDTEHAAYLKDAVQAEIDSDSPLKNRQFKDSKMQESVISYINTLNASLEVIKNNSVSSATFNTEWSKVYDQRTQLLKTFVDDYDFKVSSKYQSALDEITAKGAAAMKKSQTDQAINGLIAAAKFEKSNDGYGLYTYSAVIQNTSSFNFSHVSVLLSLYDENGIKQEETYADTSSWLAGEKVKFESSSDTDAANIKASVDDYEVSD